MDGLLLDSERYLYIRIGMDVSKQLGMPLTQEFLASLMGGSWSLYPQKVQSAYGPDFPIDEYMRRYWQRVDEVIYEEPIPLRPGVTEVRNWCREHGVKMAIATSTYYEKTIPCLKNAGIDGYFDYVIAGDMVSKGKPDPEIFLKAIRHFNIPVEEALVFEDGHNGAQAAIRGGCPLIIVKDLAQLSEEDYDRAVMVTDDIRHAIPNLEKEYERTAGIQT